MSSNNGKGKKPLPSQEKFTFATGPDLDARIRQAAHEKKIAASKLVREFVIRGLEGCQNDQSPKATLWLDGETFGLLETIAGRLKVTPEGLVQRLLVEHSEKLLLEAKDKDINLNLLKDKFKNANR